MSGIKTGRKGGIEKFETEKKKEYVKGWQNATKKYEKINKEMRKDFLKKYDGLKKDVKKIEKSMPHQSLSAEEAREIIKKLKGEIDDYHKKYGHLTGYTGICGCKDNGIKIQFLIDLFSEKGIDIQKRSRKIWWMRTPYFRIPKKKNKSRYEESGEQWKDGETHVRD